MTEDFRRIAILGGTFDPIHFGHLLIAEQAYNRFSLDKVIFMPAGAPPHKLNNKVTASRHRLEMLKLAIQDNPHFSYSEYELKKEGNSYTVDTLRYLQGLNIADKIYFIIGADSLLDIYNWKDTKYLLEYGFFIVAQRPSFSLQDIFLEKVYEPYFKHIQVMDNFLLDLSSSQIREAVKAGDSIKYQTTSDVIAYIEENKLY